MQSLPLIHKMQKKSQSALKAMLLMGVMFAPNSLNANELDITTWEDNFDTSGHFNKPTDEQFSFDANNPFETNFAEVQNNSVTPLLSDQTLAAMEQAMARYQGIEAGGGWPIISTKLKRGDISPDVLKLRQRLYLVGDIERVSGDANAFDYNVDQAVRRFQARHGLPVDGVVKGETLEALSFTAAERAQQISINIDRLKSAMSKLHDRSIVVNIPDQRVETIEEGRVISRHNVIVGQPDRETPTISSTISQVNFNPYWHVPVSIVKADLIPKILSDPTYAERTGMRVYKSWGGQEIDINTIDFNDPKAERYAYRQDPGIDNALGELKLNFPNKHAVFLHDTPSKSLFARNYRAYSSGCVRVQNIRQVIDWVLKDKDDWSKLQSKEALSNGDRIDVNLKQKISMRIIYATAWVTPAGTVHFRNDLYHKDGLRPAPLKESVS